MAEVFVLSVFCGEGAVGNPTGVVLTDAEPDEAAAQSLSARLGFPDTAFTWVDAAGARHVRFFSPSEPLSACYQALLGAACALGGDEIRFVLRDRTLAATRSEGRWWVHTPRALVRREGEVDTPLGRGVVVDAGRRRAYVRVDGATFAAARWDPDEALAWLHGTGLSGVCLVHDREPTGLDLRVFTTSLGGREDVATGGAVAGLPELPEAPQVAHPRVVRQGVGPALRRGELVVRTVPGEILVGGRVELLVRGTSSGPLPARGHPADGVE